MRVIGLAFCALLFVGCSDYSPEEQYRKCVLSRAEAVAGMADDEWSQQLNATIDICRITSGLNTEDRLGIGGFPMHSGWRSFVLKQYGYEAEIEESEQAKPVAEEPPKPLDNCGPLNNSPCK